MVLDLGTYPGGREMLKQVRREWPGVPVAICSAYEGHRHDPEISSAEVFLAKSADAAALVATVGRLLAQAGGPGAC